MRITKQDKCAIIIPLILISLLIIFPCILYFQNKGFITGSVDTPKGEIQCIGTTSEFYVINVTKMNPTVGVTGVDWFLYNQENQTVVSNYGSVDEIYGLVEGNVTFQDKNRDGKVSPDDIFTILKELPNEKKILPNFHLALKFSPTNEIICSQDFNNETPIEKSPIKPVIWNGGGTEKNNTLSILSPDYSFSNNPILGRGDHERKITINLPIFNNGTNNLSNVSVKFKDGDVVIGTRNFSIDGGEKINVVQDWKIKKDIDIGTHTIKIEIDPNDLINETGYIARAKVVVVESTSACNSFSVTFSILIFTVTILLIISSMTHKKKR